MSEFFSGAHVSWYSVYGTGATLHGISRSEDGRVEFTSWLSIVWMPIIPLSSWSAVYVGERPPDGITDESLYFTDLRRLPHDLVRIVQTFVRNLLLMAVAIIPSAVMIVITTGRAATKIEMFFVFASALWVVALIIWSEHHHRNKLKGV